MDNSPMWDLIMERIQLRPDQIPQYRRTDMRFVAAGDRPWMPLTTASPTSSSSSQTATTTRLA